MDIKAKFWKDNFGGVLTAPKRLDVQEAIRTYFGQWNVVSNSTALIQNEVRRTLGEFLTDEQIDEVLNGYTVVTDVDPWAYLNLYGWDAKEGIVITETEAYAIEV